MRNKNIEAFRGIAIIYMVLYHLIVIIMSNRLLYPTNLIVESIGQFAMVCFFVISGYGLYLSFDNKERENKKITFLSFYKNRIVKILPVYYICILIILFFTSSAGYISFDKIKYIIESLLLIQNYDVTHSLNGATWTIAVFMQFYLIAIPIYKIIKKYDWKGYTLITIIVIILKKIIFSLVFKYNLGDIYYVVFNIRNPITTIDLFAIGMLGAKKIRNNKERKISIKNIIFISVLIIAYHVIFYWYSKITGGLFGNRWTCCIWQSIIGIYLSYLILYFSSFNNKWESKLGKLLQFVAKNEYGIYLWHMPLIGNLITFSPIIVSINNSYPVIAIIIIFMLAIVFGSLYLESINCLLKNSKIIKRLNSSK